MKKTTSENPVREFSRKRKQRHRLRRLITSLAAIVVFGTVYALVLPAMTMEAETYCGFEEAHGKDCYATVEVLTCGQEESDTHQHSDSCYTEQPMLICTKELHEHTQQCFSNPDAEVMTLENVEARYEDTDLTGNWADDVLTICEAQVGVAESEDKFEATPSGDRNGSNPYSDTASNNDCKEHWDTDFAKVVLREAGVDSDTVPVGSDSASTVEKLSEKDLYHDAKDEGDGYAVKEGDLIFHENAGGETTVGIVVEVKDEAFGDEQKIKVVEGDCNDKVDTITIKSDDESIVGFGELPEDPEPETLTPVDMNTLVDEDSAPVEGEAAAEGEAPVEGEPAAEGEVPVEGEPAAEGEAAVEEQPAAEGEAAPVEEQPAVEEETPAEEVVEEVVEEPVLAEEADAWLLDKMTEKFALTAECENGVTVTMDGPVASLPFPAEECMLTAKEVTDQAVIDSLVQSAAEQGVDLTGQLLLDVCLWHDGVEIEPVGPVTVSFSGYEPAKEAAEAQRNDDVEVTNEIEVYHVDSETSNVENMGAKVNVFGDVEIETDHCSVYAIVNNNLETQYKYEEVKSGLDSTSKYLIVYKTDAENGYAITGNADANATPIQLKEIVSGGYTVSALNSNLLWKFESGGNSGNIKNIGTGKYIAMGNSFLADSGQSINYSYDSGWVFNRTVSQKFGIITFNTIYYANYKESTFTRDSNNSKKFTIYKQVPAYDITKNIDNSYTVKVYGKNSDNNEITYLGSVTVNSNTEQKMDDLFTNYVNNNLVAGNFKKAYFGTASGESLDNVISIYRKGTQGSGTYSLAVKHAAGTNERYATGNEAEGLYLVYTVPQPEWEAGETPNSLKDYTTSGAKSVKNQDFGTNTSIKFSAYSDKATSALENRFLTDGHTTGDNSGRVLTDKSVVYQHNDYYHDGDFADNKYAADEFSVTLSALAQQYNYVIPKSDRENPIDVVLVLDMSTSMYNNPNNVDKTATRAATMAKATNVLVEKIFEYHDENQVGIAVYNNSSSEFVPIGRYTKTSGKDYLTYVDTSSGPGKNNGIRYLTFNSTETTVGPKYFESGTFTQSGIKQAADMLTTDTVKNDGRKKLIILLTDGEPSCSCVDYTNPSTRDMIGIWSEYYQGYNTILTAQYYKNLLNNDSTIKQNGGVDFYTIGFGIDADDLYMNTVLNPTKANVDALKNDTQRCKDLYDLLFGVKNTFSYTKNWTTKTVTVSPITSYENYADGAYTSANYDPQALERIYDEIIQKSMDITVRVDSFAEKDRSLIDTILGKAPLTDLVMTDVIGDGMEIKGAPVLLFGNDDSRMDYQAYTVTETQESSNTVTYHYSGEVTPQHSTEAVDLDRITVTVTGAPGNRQTVTWTIPGELVPELTMAETSTWFYQEQPIRLVYKVGLTENTKIAVQNLIKSDGEVTYYTNLYSEELGQANDPAATARFTPSVGDNKNEPFNPYFVSFGEDGKVVYTAPDGPFNKANSANVTGTLNYSYDSDVDNADVITAMGNNGKLVFTSTWDVKPDDVTVRKVWDDNQVNHNDFVVNLNLYRSGTAGPVKTITLNAENEWEVRITGLQPAPEGSDPYTYYVIEDLENSYKSVSASENTSGKEERRLLSESGYSVSYSSNANGTDAAENGAEVTVASGGTITVTNASGYELPETGGPGTTGLYLAGILLVVSAAGFAIVKRRGEQAV